MLVKNEINFDRIIDVIESLDNTLYYDSVELFEEAMNTIGFKVKENKIFDDYSNQIGTGVLGKYLVELNFFKNETKSLFYLMVKIFQTKESVKHRENDLPAVTEYNDDGHLLHLSYYINGEEFRKNKQPIFISYNYKENPNQLIKYYRYFTSFEYNEDDFTIYYITFTEDTVIDCAFCYKRSLLSLDELITVVPEFKFFHLDELLDGKSKLSLQQLALIDMAFI